MYRLHYDLKEALDSPLNGVFGIFLIIWGVLYLESWKNKEKMIAFQWDTESQGAKKDDERTQDFLSNKIYNWITCCEEKIKR